MNRTPERAAALASTIGDQFGQVPTSGGSAISVDLAAYGAVVNASSAGMTEYGSSSLVPPSALRPDLLVMDIVYKPLETELLAAARSVGARPSTASGCSFTKLAGSSSSILV